MRSVLRGPRITGHREAMGGEHRASPGMNRLLAQGIVTRMG
jgi:hypothetical protein